jgi:hypothetical protein
MGTIQNRADANNITKSGITKSGMAKNDLPARRRVQNIIIVVRY